MIRPDFWGDEDLGAVDSGIADRLAHRPLIAIKGGGVDEAIARPQGFKDGLGLPDPRGAESENGNGVPVMESVFWDHLPLALWETPGF